MMHTLSIRCKRSTVEHKGCCVPLVIRCAKNAAVNIVVVTVNFCKALVLVNSHTLPIKITQLKKSL